MARVLGFLGSGRKDGYTVRVLKEVLRGAGELEDVETELVHLLDYKFGPCTACYQCIRSPEHRCILPDDMGHKGGGRLWKKVESANGIVLAAPVHFWTIDALTRLFVERLYPFAWSGELKGIPVVTITVASNQGFQITANELLCQLAFTLGMRYIGGLPIHVAYLDEALPKARYLGLKLGEAALKDEREGRKAMSDEELWLYYEDKPWNAFERYLKELTMGTGNPQLSIIKRALARGVFKKDEAIKQLKRADEEFDKCIHYVSLGERRKAIKSLVKATAFWTDATYKEFLEEQLIKAPKPKTYRPIDEYE